MNAVTKRILIEAGFAPASDVSPVWKKGSIKAQLDPENARVLELSADGETKRLLVNSLKLSQVQGFEREIEQLQAENHDITN